MLYNNTVVLYNTTQKHLQIIYKQTYVQFLRLLKTVLKLAVTLYDDDKTTVELT